MELGVDASKPLVAEQTRNPEAYNWFIRGRAVLDWANPEITDQSISYLDRAVEADPDYALAWGYLAWARALSLLWRSFEQISLSVIEAYERALALNPDQSEALAAKALMTVLLDHDWEAAGKMYQRALAAPDNTYAIVGYTVFFLQHVGEIELAIRLLQEAEERDPLHAGYKANMANIFLSKGEAEAAVLKAREALELNDKHIIALIQLISGQTALGKYSELQQLIDSLPEELQQWPNIEIRTGIYYAAAGEIEKAREIYREYTVNPPYEGGMVIIAALALQLGDVEGAIDIMEGEVERNSWTQAWARTLYRDNEVLKDHPRYLAVLESMRLDDESVAELNRRMTFD